MGIETDVIIARRSPFLVSLSLSLSLSLFVASFCFQHTVDKLSSRVHLPRSPGMRFGKLKPYVGQQPEGNQKTTLSTRQFTVR